jgi:hypothetical protein
MTWTGGAQVAIFRGGEARLNSPVNSSESVSMYGDSGASASGRSLLELHTSLRCLEAKMWTWRCQNFWEDLEKIGKTFFQSRGAKKSKIAFEDE